MTTEKATTTSYGEMQYTCATCGNTYTQEIQPLELGVSNVTSVTVSGSGFKVKWSKVSGASGYKLYRKTASGDYVLAKKTSSTSYTDSGLTAGTKYTYVVKAYNSVQTADEGTSMSYTFIKKTSISSLTSTSKGVKIKWKAVSGAKNYVIYRNGTKVTTTTSTSYVDTGATTNGKAYKYYILTYVDSSSYSKSAVKKTYYLKTQAISSAVNKSGKKIQVKYSKNNRATGYQIQYSTSSKFTSSKTTTKKVTSYKTVSKTLTKLTKNKTYYVRVRSYKKVSDTVYYGAWSAKKKVKVTK
ncbi:MAG: fibronectin type III domain-containing protein [Lachnospiraceae bacterium]|nr:fibronectin type III domain-containing protein [Lachnospiraceae bacterium]